MENLTQCWEYVHNNIAETDKGTKHTFLPLYNQLFAAKRMKPVTLLEIGVAGGGSLAMWNRFFSDNSTIYGIDKNKPKIDLDNVIIGNAYDKKIFKQLPKKFDIIIDDGSHILKDILFVVKNYVSLLNKDGILIID